APSYEEVLALAKLGWKPMNPVAWAKAVWRIYNEIKGKDIVMSKFVDIAQQTAQAIDDYLRNLEAHWSWALKIYEGQIQSTRTIPKMIQKAYPYPRELSTYLDELKRFYQRAVEAKDWERAARYLSEQREAIRAWVDHVIERRETIYLIDLLKKGASALRDEYRTLTLQRGFVAYKYNELVRIYGRYSKQALEAKKELYELDIRIADEFYTKVIEEKERVYLIDLLKKGALALRDEYRNLALQRRLEVSKYREAVRVYGRHSKQALEAKKELYELDLRITDELYRRTTQEIERRYTRLGLSFIGDAERQRLKVLEAREKLRAALKYYGKTSEEYKNAQIELLEAEFEYRKAYLSERESILEKLHDLQMISDQQLASFYTQMISLYSRDLSTQLDYIKKLRDLTEEAGASLREAIGLPQVRVPTPQEVQRFLIGRLFQNIQFNLNISREVDIQRLLNLIARNVLGTPALGGAYV
ncbi:MAG: hypothetical protein QXQ02_07310, partial [Halobacteria archaeon]